MLKAFIKSMLRGLAISCVSPILLSHWVASLVTTADASLESHSQVLALLPGRAGNYLRVAFYRFALEHCDPTATICFGTLFSKVGARIGQHVYIGPRCLLGLVTLRDDVLLGPAVQIPSGPMTHGISRTDLPIRLQRGDSRRVEVGPDTWIGANSIVLANIGPQVVIGAGSVVIKSVPKCVVAAGTPTRIVKSRDPEAPTSLADGSGE